MKKKHRTQRWSQVQLELLGKFPDSIVAKQLSRYVRSVSRRRQRLGIPAVRPRGFDPKHKHLLGTMRDADLAIKLGCARITIIKWRIKCGIPCFASKSRPWTKDELALLGKYPDKEVARRLNRDREKVRNKRLSIEKKQNTRQKMKKVPERSIRHKPKR